MKKSEVNIHLQRNKYLQNIFRNIPPGFYMPSIQGPLGNSYVKQVRIGFYEIPMYLKNPNQECTPKNNKKNYPKQYISHWLIIHQEFVVFFRKQHKAR